MSDIQLQISEQFINEMGALVYNPRVVNSVISYIRTLSTQEQVRKMTLTEINERLNVAESEAAYGVGVTESEARIKRHQYIDKLLKR